MICSLVWVFIPDNLLQLKMNGWTDTYLHVLGCRKNWGPGPGTATTRRCRQAADRSACTPHPCLCYLQVISQKVVEAVCRSPRWLLTQVALTVPALPVCILPIAVTRAGSMSQLSPAAEAKSNTLRVTWKVEKVWNEVHFTAPFICFCISSVSLSELWMYLSGHTGWDLALFLVTALLCLCGRMFPLMWFQVQSERLSLTEARAVADVFGVILAWAVARLSCLTQGQTQVGEGDFMSHIHRLSRREIRNSIWLAMKFLFVSPAPIWCSTRIMFFAIIYVHICTQICTLCGSVESQSWFETSW